MTPEENIANITAAIAEAQNVLADDQGQRASMLASVEAWKDKGRRMGMSTDVINALGIYAGQITAIEAKIATDKEHITQLQQQLDQAVKAKDAMDDAREKAAAEGLTGKAAEIHAEATLAKSKALATAGVIGAVVIAGIILVFAWRKYMRKK